MINVVVIATNAYFVLGLRFIQNFLHHYRGGERVLFHFFSDTDPADFLPQHFPVHYYPTHHDNWVDGTNSKFQNLLSVPDSGGYLYYFDADTNVTRDFADWFLGELVGGEHYGNRGWMKDRKAYDRNPRSMAYVPEDTPLPQTYYYGAFFGGRTPKVRAFCQTLRAWQELDRAWGYEPAVNDESYINKYFHTYPPLMIPVEDFPFEVSDKGGLGETRDTTLDTTELKLTLLQNRGKRFDIQNNQIHFL